MKEFDVLEADPVPGHEMQSAFGIDVRQCKYTGGTGIHRPLGLIRANSGGILIPHKRPGEPLSQGDVIAEVRDLHGETVEEITMPEDGSIWAYPCSQFFETGGMQQTIEEGGKVAFGFTKTEDS